MNEGFTRAAFDGRSPFRVAQLSGFRAKGVAQLSRLACAFATVVALPKAAVMVTGIMKGFLKRSDSGNPIERIFCPDGGSSRPPCRKPGKV
jgi:hypothetical protein